MHACWCLKHCVLHAWMQQFVPRSKEEKIKELRRTELRRKVAASLPDYQPRNFGKTVNLTEYLLYSNLFCTLHFNRTMVTHYRWYWITNAHTSKHTCSYCQLPQWSAT